MFLQQFKKHYSILSFSMQGMLVLKHLNHIFSLKPKRLFIYKQYQIIELTRDLNPVIITGLVGTILEVWSDNAYEVEFLNEQGFSYEYNGMTTFTVEAADIKPASNY